ncbi:MAG: bifunctional demethylmenaquinone methyltransferase/2-methoxy-6-polyprenyl-1,4-benzoquinol methylase UbiE [Tannerella sp.]|jgi:demethylmenaquinone methyltransferase/2-methoxy-6-polyprenyl-1,4-benzoquinol methylase|nr:bifunctional demethylmenaquinone methyltransferase/2-methoxy-6-polyprenyl-1,4-benzoquinol methylase UbiE [Tannerella sp.]
MIEQILPYGNTGEKGEQVRLMFDKIASRYDRLNRIMSLGFDKRWRKNAVDWLRPYYPKKILDVACGTGDLSIMLRRQFSQANITGVDVSEEMMKIARHKTDKTGEYVMFEYQDCMLLTYPDCSFDTVTVAFGVRNFGNIERGISEMYRVLRPEGHVLILELSTPEGFPMSFLFKIYSSIYIPFIGGILSPDSSAYKYLPVSIKAMPQGRDMTGILEKAGFKNIYFKRFTGGICTMYTAAKN